MRTAGPVTDTGVDVNVAETPTSSSRKIVLVEDQAHVQLGHFPVLFAELAEALHDVGCEVTVLTLRGWALERTANARSFEIRQLGRMTRAVRRCAGFVDRLPPRQRRQLARRWRDAVMVVAMRRVRREVGEADVIVTSHLSDPLTWALLAGPGRVSVYQFGSAGFSPRWLHTFARLAEQRRNRRGGSTTVLVSTKEAQVQWLSAVSWLAVAHVPFAMVRPVDRQPGARKLLGIDEGPRIALVFGSAHDGKDLDTVWRAFQSLPDWRLVVAGKGVCEAYLAWQDQAEKSPSNVERPAPALFPGYASNELRHWVHSAADIVILSFTAGNRADSGTLADAISHGVPVVCSDQSLSGETVARLGLGRLFVSADPGSLAAAVADTSMRLDPGSLERARHKFCAHRLANRHLDALGGRLSADHHGAEL